MKELLEEAIVSDIDSQLQHVQRKVQRAIDLVRFGFATARKSASMSRLSFPDRPFEFTMAVRQAEVSDDLVSEFRRWLLGHGFQEVIENVQTHLDWAASFCWSLKLIAEKGLPPSTLEVREYSDDVEVWWRKVHAMPLKNKMEKIRKDFGITTDLDESILSIHGVRNCLTHRAGIVDENVDRPIVKGALTAVWVGAVIEKYDERGAVPVETLEDLVRSGLYLLGSEARRRSFQPGARVTLDSRDFNEVAITAYIYCREVTKKAVEFARRCGLPATVEALTEEWSLQTSIHLYLNVPDGDVRRSEAVVVDWRDGRLRPVGTRKMEGAV